MTLLYLLYPCVSGAEGADYTNFCFNRARDLISSVVYQKLNFIDENVQTIENRSRITAVLAEYDIIKIGIYMHENPNL